MANVMRTDLLLLCLFQVFFVGLTLARVRPKDSDEHRLFSDILGKHYNKFVRPSANSTQPSNITLQIYLKKIMTVDEKMEYMYTRWFLVMSWDDYRLAWDPKEYGGLEQVVVPGQTVWLPDIALFNAVYGYYIFASYVKYGVILNSKGKMVWTPGGTYKTSCSITVTYFPFDRQHCKMTFESFTHTANQVQLLKRPGGDTVNLDVYKRSDQWRLENVTAIWEKEPTYESFWTTRIHIDFHITRKCGYYVINILTPCVMISLLAVTVFCVPPDSGERVSLGISILLTLTVFLLLVADNIPKTSDELPLLALYLCVLMGMSALAVILSVIIIHVYNIGGRAIMSDNVRKFIFSYLARVICMNRQRHIHAHNMRRFSTNHHTTNNIISKTLIMEPEPYINNIVNKDFRRDSYESDDRMGQDYMNALEDEWKMAARILDRFLLIFYFVTIVLINSIFLVLIPIILSS
ncbi:acetylcholine receptor subunit beta-type acr-3-like isoform X2 [Lineus longissimus]|uniref:acetylcholine receptor subunit beta-type acr-3-like isoform X2 n=1 Tax=Lineus longissimus TaxID=88925 RepID=UPI002B4D6CD9